MPGLPILRHFARGIALGLVAVGSARSKLASGVLTMTMNRFPIKVMLGFVLLLTAALLSLKQQSKVKLSSNANQTGPTISHSPPEPSPNLMSVDQVRAKEVLDQLALADLQLIPKAELLPDGSTRYHYKRRDGDPTLSIEQIRALMLNPPTFDSERLTISSLWQLLEAKGIQIRLTVPKKQGAAGEWDPRDKTIRIHPEVLAKGSKEFAWVLNHEAIHVSQSCKKGSLTANPEVIGLAKSLPPELEFVLQKPQYRNTSLQSKSLEREAFANQSDLEVGPSLVKAYCF